MKNPQRLLSIILFILLTSGCTILDEIDAASAKMPSNRPVASSGGTAPGSAAPPAPNALLEQSKEWWGRATSMSPNQMSASIVNCRIGKNAQFMSKDDCLTRGGVPQGQS